MKIIDTNTINYIFDNNLELEDQYFIAPDVKIESEITEMIIGNKMHTNIKEVEKQDFFNEAVYLKNYVKILNKYAGRSFFNMTGFGDVSIMAVLELVYEHFESNPNLFGEVEDIVLITNDLRLKKKVIREFNSEYEKVILKDFDSIL